MSFPVLLFEGVLYFYQQLYSKLACLYLSVKVVRNVIGPKSCEVTLQAVWKD